MASLSLFLLFPSLQRDDRHMLSAKTMATPITDRRNTLRAIFLMAGYRRERRFRKTL